jgi:hypothetical protein
VESTWERPPSASFGSTSPATTKARLTASLGANFEFKREKETNETSAASSDEEALLREVAKLVDEGKLIPLDDERSQGL